MQRFGAGILLTLFAGIAGAVLAQGPSAPPPFSGVPGSACATPLMSVSEYSRHDGASRDIPVWQLPGSNAFFYVTNMAIDADGAPNAYSPDDSGLDDLRNAGEPGQWDGLATGPDQTPYIQQATDPFPGFYVSETALSDRTKRPWDPTRYVDATKIPYIVLPHDLMRQTGTRLGDFAAVFNLQNDKSSPAIFADIGENVGEGSVALADNLGVRSSPRRGGIAGGILYLIFPGSGNHQPRSADEIASESQKLLSDSGGADRLTACATGEFQRADE